MEQQNAEHQEPLEAQADQPHAVDASISKLEELANDVEGLSQLGSIEWVGKVAQAALQDLNASSHDTRQTRSLLRIDRSGRKDPIRSTSTSNSVSGRSRRLPHFRPAKSQTSIAAQLV